MEKLLEKALRIATAAHRGQVDKAGQPYILHPMRVAQKCATPDEKIVALLHDTIEDSDVTPERLQSEGFPQHIVDAVLSVTRRDDETYEDFIRRSSHNPLARTVKMHDLEDNMDITRLNEITEKDRQRLNKYLKAYRYLQSAGEE